MHYGPRPVFHDTESCEVHLIDASPTRVPVEVTVETVARLRDVRDFPTVEALQEQMDRDIEEARAILQAP